MIDAQELATLFGEAARAIDPFAPLMASTTTQQGAETTLNMLPDGWQQRKATADVLYAIARVYRNAVPKP